MFEMKPIARQVLFACGSVTAVMLAAPVSAQTPPPPPTPQALERVTITGSNIRRTDTETVAPVQIITREELERSGKPTVAEALRAIPGNTGASYDESFSNSFAPGAAGIALRGLGQKTTLVLINGRRTAGYGFAQNLQDTFVDLNSIPISAVERIEILKDGASAIYGSDAIAGVVNVILRRDFKGAEANGGYGSASGGSETRASFGMGFGDLGSQKFNVFGVFDYFKRDEILLSDTDYLKSRDLRGLQGGRNFQSLTAGGTWTGIAATPNANERRAVSDCANWGRVLDYTGAVNAGLINLGLGGTPAPLGTGLNLAGNTWCAVDINSALSAVPGTTRLGFLSRATFDVSSSVQLFAEFGISKIETEQTFTPPFFAATTGLAQTPAGLRPFTYNVTFAPGAAGNPLAANARFTGNLFALGTRDAEITSDTMRALVGAKWSVAGWDMDSAIGRSENEVDAKFTNRILKTATSTMLGVTPAVQPPIPVSTSLPSATICNLNSTSTSAACRSALSNVLRKATSEMELIDTKASTELGQLPGGPVGFATGFEYRRESIKDRPDILAQTGEILGQGITATDGSRHQAAIYAELALPLTRQLEMQAAVRNDSYSDFGTALTPKLGMKFKASPEFVMRANWGRGFRAPSLPEISPSVATFFVTVFDPVLGVNQQVSGVFAGNPGLAPEKSRSTTLGFVWEPSNSFNLSVDYYEINWSNIVGSDSFSNILNADAATRNPLTCTGGDPRVIRNLDPTSFCQVVTILNNYRNLARTLTAGYDFDVRYTVRTGMGRFLTNLNASYVDKFEEDGVESAGNNNGSATIPRLKAALTQDWEQGPYLLRARLNYIHSYVNLFLAGTSFQAPQNPLFQTGTLPRKVSSLTTLDLLARYNFTPKLGVSAAVVNATNAKPPYDPSFGTQFYDFALYDVRGRQYRLNVNYKF